MFVLDKEQVTCQQCLERSKGKTAAPPMLPHSPPSRPPTTRLPKGSGRIKKTTSQEPPNGVIVALVKLNPRKKGTGKYERMALLLQHNGKTVAEFAAAGGNLETLSNAI